MPVHQWLWRKELPTKRQAKWFLMYTALTECPSEIQSIENFTSGKENNLIVIRFSGHRF